MNLILKPNPPNFNIPGKCFQKILRINADKYPELRSFPHVAFIVQYSSKLSMVKVKQSRYSLRVSQRVPGI